MRDDDRREDGGRKKRVPGADDLLLRSCLQAEVRRKPGQVHGRKVAPLDPLSRSIIGRWRTASRSASRKSSRSSIPQTWELRSHVVGAPRLELAGARRADQARAPPVDRRGRHADLRERRASCATRSSASARELDRRRRARRPRRRGRRHPPVLALEGSGHLSLACATTASSRSCSSSRGRCSSSACTSTSPCPTGQTMIDLMNEVRYFLPHLLALSTSSPFWMGRDTGLKSYPHDDLPPLSAHRRPRSLRLVERVRELRQTARRSALHRRRARRSGGTCARIRRSARWSSASATCRHGRKRR